MPQEPLLAEINEHHQELARADVLLNGAYWRAPPALAISVRAPVNSSG